MPNVRQHAEQQQQQQSAMEDSDDDMRNELGLPSAASTATVKPVGQVKDLKYTTMFAAVDADSDGAIDVDELITGLRKLGMLAKTKAEAQQLLDRFGNGQGFVEQAGFVELAKHVEYESLFDTDGDGELGALERIMMKYDADKSGEFSVREVKKIVDDLQNEKKQACS